MLPRLRLSFLVLTLLATPGRAFLAPPKGRAAASDRRGFAAVMEGEDISLGFDFGTSGARCAAVTASGEQVIRLP